MKKEKNVKSLIYINISYLIKYVDGGAIFDSQVWWKQ